MADEYTEVGTLQEFLDEIKVAGAKVKLLFDIDVSQYPKYREDLGRVAVSCAEIDFNGHYLKNFIADIGSDASFFYTTNTNNPLYMHNGGIINGVVNGSGSNVKCMHLSGSVVKVEDFKITLICRPSYSATPNVTCIEGRSTSNPVQLNRVAVSFEVQSDRMCNTSVITSAYGDQVAVDAKIYGTVNSSTRLIRGSNSTTYKFTRVYAIGELTVGSVNTYTLMEYCSQYYVAIDFKKTSSLTGTPLVTFSNCTNGFMVTEEITDATIRSAVESSMPSGTKIVTRANAKNKSYLTSIGWLP